MTNEPAYRLLLVDDEPRMAQILRIACTRWGYNVETAANGEEALAKLADFSPEIVLSDIKMPGMDGETLLRRVKAASPGTVVVLMTAFGTVKGAVEAMREGAFDYILKPFDNEELRMTLARAREVLTLRTDNSRMRAELGIRSDADRIVGESPALAQVLQFIERVAPTRATVLVTGESGTGKELVARAIHRRSPRAGAPFIAVNCAALAESLLESELFGHEKGAFTGALRQHRGKFEEASGGTIFLDEIGETGNGFQTKLLRVLQEGRFERVGGTAPVQVDVRVVAATNRDLEQRIREGHFREDLFFRLNVIPIHLPPLRERRGDIPALARHFAARSCADLGIPRKTLSDAALAALAAAEWKGNIRELENTMERAVILSPLEEIQPEDLWATRRPAPPPANTSGSQQPQSASAATFPDPDAMRLPLAGFVEEMTRLRVLAALESANWRRQDAAEALGVDRATLYRMIKRYGIEREE
ncbi:MAG: sigma-54 dependent transcriptional regulator [Candidatus Sumerlaeia bacterium]|nr:sigma-54 dependent transcriptional regulator [Candidatus Sumerlaeia bacterium]